MIQGTKNLSNLDLSERNPNTNKPSSYKLLKNVRQTIAAVFSFAINTCNGLYRNPADVVEIPTGAGTTERQALTLEQQMKIVETTHRARYKGSSPVTRSA